MATTYLSSRISANTTMGSEPYFKYNILAGWLYFSEYLGMLFHLTGIIHLSWWVTDLPVLDDLGSPSVSSTPPFYIGFTSVGKGPIRFLLFYRSYIIELGCILEPLPKWPYERDGASLVLSIRSGFFFNVNAIVTGLLVLNLILLHREFTRAFPGSSWEEMSCFLS